MGRRPLNVPLNIFLNGRPVGRLRRAASGAIDFQYDPAWLVWDYALPVSLSLPLREDRYIGEPARAVFDTAEQATKALNALKSFRRSYFSALVGP